MAKYLTVRQLQILDFINEFIKTNDYSPTLEELASSMCISPPAALKHIRALSNKNVVSFIPNQARSIKIITNTNDIRLRLFSIPFFENEPNNYEYLSYLNIARQEENPSYPMEYKISSLEVEDDDYFAVRITVPTMDEAGIKVGDIAIIKATTEFKNNDIVLIIPSEDDNTIQSSLRRFVKISETRCNLETDSLSLGTITTYSYRVLGILTQIKRIYNG